MSVDPTVVPSRVVPERRAVVQHERSDMTGAAFERRSAATRDIQGATSGGDSTLDGG
ncbi:hypothetical protein [Sorangium sp. So ce204]|uniref:hypothetical protein n=1 Tax=Sorangium sp. So ce204 TaxID=3133288 RepID=UPI003F60D3A2